MYIVLLVADAGAVWAYLDGARAIESDWNGCTFARHVGSRAVIYVANFNLPGDFLMRDCSIHVCGMFGVVHD